MATAYIDGVKLGVLDGKGQPVDRRPTSTHFFNAFQENSSSYYDTPNGIPAPAPGMDRIHFYNLSEGEPMRGIHIEGTDDGKEINVGLEESHVTIDDNEILIGDIQLFIKNSFSTE